MEGAELLKTVTPSIRRVAKFMASKLPFGFLLDADDLEQHGLLAASQSIKTINPELSSPSTWAINQARWAMKMAVRDVGSLPISSSSFVEDCPSSFMPSCAVEVSEEVNSLLDKLDVRRRLVASRYWLEEKKTSEIANEVKLSKEGVCCMLRTIIRDLRVWSGMSSGVSSGGKKGLPKIRGSR